ncbi:MAG: hypothetical protein R3B07_18825 [Polyangiaceae bacterium]
MALAQAEHHRQKFNQLGPVNYFDDLGLDLQGDCETGDYRAD